MDSKSESHHLPDCCTHVRDELLNAQQNIEFLLSSISSLLISVDIEDRITRWNKSSEVVFDLSAADVIGKPFTECGIEWAWERVLEGIYRCRETFTAQRVDDVWFRRKNGTDGLLGVTINPLIGTASKKSGFVLLGADITDIRAKETMATHEQKMLSIGQLAAGIAHEINTPIQYVGDNLQFLRESFEHIVSLLGLYDTLLQATRHNAELTELVAKVDSASEEADLEYLFEEVPLALQQSIEGVERVGKIVLSMKQFSHPGHEEMTLLDINAALENTATVSRNEWKYVSDLELDLDPDLPFVPVLPGELHQVFLNLILNAAHAIEELNPRNSGRKGKIVVQTRAFEDIVEIRISDTGAGIPEHVRHRIFDPFFTTKKIGKGTGQGLAISHAVIVKKHKGTIGFETESGKGTTFILRLPRGGH
ncbi:ATP-binding protein [Desulfovibrio inopinatus]|uniref:ATP-binding protein n=1 Tax=Desulfovibrio inopinatus TaxID=102109 RepID=UPI00040B0106|nr:ATP-binding protein [Desulfovibrio inopinatus]